MKRVETLVVLVTGRCSECGADGAVSPGGLGHGGIGWFCAGDAIEPFRYDLRAFMSGVYGAAGTWLDPFAFEAALLQERAREVRRTVRYEVPRIATISGGNRIEHASVDGDRTLCGLTNLHRVWDEPFRLGRVWECLNCSRSVRARIRSA